MNFLKEIQRRNNEKPGWVLILEREKKIPLLLRQEEMRRVIVIKHRNLDAGFVCPMDIMRAPII